LQTTLALSDIIEILVHMVIRNNTIYMDRITEIVVYLLELLRLLNI
jgi:hypothetical protein